MAKPRLLDVLDTMAVPIVAAINAANIIIEGVQAPGQVVNGWTVTTELTKILALGGGNFQTVLWPLKPMKGDVFSPNDPYCQIATAPDVTLTVAQSVITQGEALNILGGLDVDGGLDISQLLTQLLFGGTVTANYNVHTVINDVDILVQVTPGMQPSDVATAVAAAIVAAAIGVNALAYGPYVFIAGAFDCVCNIGGTGSIATEVDRITRLIQVSTYAANPMARSLIDDAIIQGLGTTVSQWLALSDGQMMHVRHASSGEQYIEKAQSSYSAFEAHTFFSVEYPIVVVSPATQIGVVEFERTIGTLPEQISYIGSAP